MNVNNFTAKKLKQVMAQLNQRGLVLMYHRVIALDRDPWQLGVTPKYFEEHMQILKKYARPVKMRDMGRNLRHLSLGMKEVVVSFDDGYADNFHKAKPILESLGIPATFFIVSGTAGNQQEYWWDELERIILAAHNLPPIFALDINGKDYQWKIGKNKENEILNYGSEGHDIPPADSVLNASQLYYVLWGVLSRLPLLKRKEALLQVGKWAGDQQIPRLDYLPMNSNEITALARHSLFEIGAHTRNHPMLSRLPDNEQEDEIARGQHDLENIINQPIVSFSYPHGSYSDVTIDIVKRLKFRCACTVRHGLVTRTTNPFLLPRIAVLNWDGELFEQNLHKWLGQSDGELQING